MNISKTPLRPSAANDFTLDVPNVGRFRFGYRRLQDEFDIQAEYSRITQGVDTPTFWLSAFGQAFAALRVLTVEAPKNWDLDTIDPFDNEAFDKVMAVFTALRAKEDSFRRKADAGGEAGGQEAGGDHGAVVSTPVQPAAE